MTESQLDPDGEPENMPAPDEETTADDSHQVDQTGSNLIPNELVGTEGLDDVGEPPTTPSEE